MTCLARLEKHEAYGTGPLIEGLLAGVGFQVGSALLRRLSRKIKWPGGSAAGSRRPVLVGDEVPKFLFSRHAFG